jgi:hypothetical protein
MIVLLNKSLTGLSLLLLFFSTYFLRRIIKKGSLKFFFISIFFIVLFGLFLKISVSYQNLEKLKDKNRFFQTVSGVLELGGSLYEYNKFEIFAFFGGKRFITVYYGYYTLLDNYGLGHGIGSHVLDFVRISDLAGINMSTITNLNDTERQQDYFKPDSYGAQIAADTGYLGLLTLLYLLYLVIKKRAPIEHEKRKNLAPLSSALFVTACYMLLFNSTTALPVPWVMLAFVYDLNNKTSENL